MSKKTLVWFRNDLRLHDNEMLVEAIAKSDEILPVYIFDPRHFQASYYKTLKTGITRAKFLLQSVSSLKKAFENLGGNLLVMAGHPEEVIPSLVSSFEISEVYHHREVASEETAVSAAVEDAIWKLKVNLKHFIGHTLYNKEDLPFPVKDIPDVFTQFKKKTERDAIVKPCFETPTHISFAIVDDWGTIPSLADLLPENTNIDVTSFGEFIGGEQEGLAHLHAHLHDMEKIVAQKVSQKKHDIVSQLSPWLSLGCLSPREVYWKTKDAEDTHGAKPNFQQIVLGLLWRDYYRFMFKKHGNTFFYVQGFTNDELSPMEVDEEALSLWKHGETGNAVVDFYMKQLNTTGYISQSARQLVAIFMVQNLNLNWVYGAAYFEEVLIDYCPASNWGNWATIAGVGNNHKLSNGYDFERLSKMLAPKSTLVQDVHV